MKSKEEEFIVQKLFHGLSAIVAAALVAGLVASVAAARPDGHKASIDVCVLLARHEVVGAVRAVRPPVLGRGLQESGRSGDDQQRAG